MMDNMNRVETWTIRNKNGDKVECYANEWREIHTRVPYCECGRPLVEEAHGEWYCSACDETTNDENFTHVFGNVDDYENYVAESGDDYGEFKYTDGRRQLVVGTPNCFFTYLDR